MSDNHPCIKWLVYMYVKGFRLKFASYGKFGSKWFRGSVKELLRLLVVRSQLCAAMFGMVWLARNPCLFDKGRHTAARAAKIRTIRVDWTLEIFQLSQLSHISNFSTSPNSLEISHSSEALGSLGSSNSLIIELDWKREIWLGWQSWKNWKRNWRSERAGKACMAPIFFQPQHGRYISPFFLRHEIEKDWERSTSDSIQSVSELVSELVSQSVSEVGIELLGQQIKESVIQN